MKSLSTLILSLLLTSSMSFSPSIGKRAEIQLPQTLKIMKPISSISHHVNSIQLKASTAAESNNDKEWTPKTLHNTSLFRSAALLSTLLLAGYKSSALNISTRVAALVHVMSFGIFFGSVVYTTFIAGITMFKNLPRQTFGKLQSKLFPIYFNLCAVTSLLQLITLKQLPKLMSQKSTIALGAAFISSLLNLFILEPASTSNMFKRYELDNVPGGQETAEYKKLKSDFGKFHGMSSMVNLIALCGVVAHGSYLASIL